jgi:hypothetical protein
MNNDKFYQITEFNDKKRIALQRIEAILFMYSMILICQCLHFEWWQKYNLACIIVSFVYLFFVIAIGEETHGVSIFRSKNQRLQDFADYCETPYFADSWDYYAPIKNGDYVALSNNEYLKLETRTSFIGKDIDFNSLYSFTVRLWDDNKIIYEIQRQDYDYRGSFNELYGEIKDKGLDIEVVYNKFGDMKWRKSKHKKKKSVIRKYILIAYQTFWIISQFIVAVLPVLFMFSTNKTI